MDTVGDSVTHVEPGDLVVLNWRAVCGECRACRKGDTKNCFNTFNASTPMTLTDGTELTAALGIGSFAEKPLSTKSSALRSTRTKILRLQASSAVASWPVSAQQ